MQKTENILLDNAAKSSKTKYHEKRKLNKYKQTYYTPSTVEGFGTLQVTLNSSHREERPPLVCPSKSIATSRRRDTSPGLWAQGLSVLTIPHSLPNNLKHEDPVKFMISHWLHLTHFPTLKPLLF